MSEPCDPRTSLIMKLLESVKPGEPLVGAEIGVWKGVLIKRLLEREPRVNKIYGIDPFSVIATTDGQRVGWGWDKEKWDSVYGTVAKELSMFGERVQLIRERSEDCVGLLPELDFVEVDGKHTYEQVMLDIELYEKKVCKGGLVCGHDYFGQKRYSIGVQKAVNEYAEMNARELHSDRGTWEWWWYK